MGKFFFDVLHDLCCLILSAATENIAGDIGIFRPCVDGYVRCGKKKIAGYAVGLELIEMFIERLYGPAFDRIGKKLFPEGKRI